MVALAAFATLATGALPAASSNRSADGSSVVLADKAVVGDGTSSPVGPDGSSVPPARRDAVLGHAWRTSNDVAWTTAGDASGLHILTARQNDGYAWKTVATLTEPGIDTSGWIGNACVTGSGDYAVVVYAPREYTNTASLSDRGGFTAVVDLRDGSVTKLPVNASLAYFDPGCGAGDEAVITQSDNESSDVTTRLELLDVARAKVTSTVTLAGQVTSAIPVGDGIVAALGQHLVRIDRSGKVKPLAATRGTAFRLHADGVAATGGVVYLETDGHRESVRHWTGTTVTGLADGAS